MNSNNNNNLTILNNNTGSKQTAELLKAHHQYQQHPDMCDALNTNEITMDLRSIIDDFSDILQNEGKQLQSLHPRQVMNSIPNNFPRALPYMPQPVHSGSTFAATQNSNSDSNSSICSDVPSIKEEPMDPQDFRKQQGCFMPQNYMPNAGYPNGNQTTFTTLTPSVLHQQHMNTNLKHKSMLHHIPRKTVKPCDKNSDEYRRRRERNNIAVRKSREKAKVRTKETEEEVRLLMKENDRLQKKIELLTEELTVLRNLFQNVGLPDHVHRELTKIQPQQPLMHDDRNRLMDIVHDYGP